eukprot:TRINITY_DN16313_c0_g1_i1.p1 TRINITY_DN16313_c0_g1~~TRINITY_DN16313_c0_g1_i1.p1  ORF type:complete len:216 (+),score=50.43 TRINITY_DN16313_c0_g1_i1:164-811(+)
MTAVSDDALRQVFVSRLPEEASEANIKEMFACCGRIEEIKPQYDAGKGEKGYLVVYTKVSSARSACALDNSVLAGVNIKVTGSIVQKDQEAASDQVVGGVEGMKAILEQQSTATPGEQLMSLIQNNLATASGVTTTVSELAEEQRKQQEPCRICTSKLHPTEGCPTLDTVSTASSSSSSSGRKRRKRSSKKEKKSSRRSTSSRKEKKSSRRRSRR